MRLRIEQVESGEDATEVPVGGVQKTHAEQSTAQAATAGEGIGARMASMGRSCPARQHAPSPQPDWGRAAELPCFTGHLNLRRSRGSGLPVPSRRTFAPGILPFTHSKETSLRHPGFARFPTPLDWHGQPLATSLAYDSMKGEQPDRRHAQKPVRLVHRWSVPKRSSRELTSPAGAEHVAGRLRCPYAARGSRVT